MIERKYDPTLNYRYVLYGRMSDPKQNKRSPDQQFNTAEETRKRLDYPWRAVARYRDDGISGRKFRKRPGLQNMLRDIETGVLNIDLIVVDTYERLGRAEEIGLLRHKLLTDHGIMVVSADNNFSDPTGIVGKAVSMVEQVRATENTRITRHQVIRGKKDAARLRRWPGAKAPFGFRLKAIVDDSVSPPDVYNVLEPEAQEAAAQLLAFQRAERTGEGCMRLSQWWNNSPEIPDEFKPISATTVGYRLANAIYVGTLVWGANCTAVVNDMRVVEPNPEGAEIIPNFCEAIVPTETFENVQQLMKARSDQIKASRQGGQDQSPTKLIKPQGRGMTLKYILTGLVRCAICNSSMRPVLSRPRAENGKIYAYTYYSCPRRLEGACKNDFSPREDELRKGVVDRLRARLFPIDGTDGQAPSWLPGLVALVRENLHRLHEQEPDRVALARQEICEIDQQLSGWTQTLGDPGLPMAVRTDIAVVYAQAKTRKEELEGAILAQGAVQQHVESLLDPTLVVDQLQKLDEILAGFNPTLCNLELSKHIESILCFPDRTVTINGTTLGCFGSAVDLLSRDCIGSPTVVDTANSNGHVPVVPRLRGRLYIPNLSAESAAVANDQSSLLDPDRFAGLPDEFRWSESFVLARKLPWAEENADAVARLRVGMTMAKLAAHFNKTVPTIRKALKIAKQKDASLQTLPQKLARSRWHEDHATEVAELKKGGRSTTEIAVLLKKSDTTIRAALKHAEQLAGGQSPALGDEGRENAASL